MADLTSIADLVPMIRDAGSIALSYYRASSLSREAKADGSLVTRADLEVQAFLLKELQQRHPQANLIAEEAGCRAFDASRPYTFVIDPIDGTTTFTAGSPGWCVSLGLLDAELRPVAGIVWAPAWDSLWFADLGPGPAYCNGLTLPRLEPAAADGPAPMMLVGSLSHRSHDFGALPAKIRSFGSSALHLCLLSLGRGYAAAHIPRSALWDVAGAHAVLERVGCQLRDAESGETPDYRKLGPDWKLPGSLLAGTPEILAAWGAKITRRASG